MRYLWLILPIFCFSCLGLKVRTVEKNAFDFSSLNRYCWLQGCEFTFQGPEHLKETFAVEAFKSAITNELNEKGYTLDDSDPDFLINMTILVEERSHDVLYVGDFASLAPPMSFSEPFTYLEGTLIVDAIDMEKTEVFWRSHASKFLEVRPDFDAKDIQKVIAKVLKEFPERIQPETESELVAAENN